MMTKSSDDDLLALLRKSNLEAFKAIYDRYFDQLTIFASLHTNGADEVKDIIQEVFFKLWNKRKTIRIKKSLKAYLFRMTYHCMINMRKKNNRLRYLQESDFNVHSIDTRERLEQKLDHEIAIQKLPEKIRPVYILKAINDLSYKEIAVTLNISIKTVEAHLTEAYKILRKLFFS